jgi:hypothetical protein
VLAADAFSGMRAIRVALVAAGLFVTGCASIRYAPSPPSMACATDAALVGVWTDARLTQLGPAWVRFSFGADCAFRTRVQLLYFRFTESGRYSAENGVVTFDRQSGATRWPYRVDAGRLVLQEARDERHVYRRR